MNIILGIIFYIFISLIIFRQDLMLYRANTRNRKRDANGELTFSEIRDPALKKSKGARVARKL
jgi:hypothetical protein